LYQSTAHGLLLIFDIDKTLRMVAAIKHIKLLQFVPQNFRHLSK